MKILKKVKFCQTNIKIKCLKIKIHLEVSNKNESGDKSLFKYGFKQIFIRKNYYSDNTDAYIMKNENWDYGMVI